ncbi:MAG: SRPBCC domain-containing protein [Anaerolineae bacterium]|nr:SRPBCC domain-containing protein [Anaerolineae bacterium]
MWTEPEHFKHWYGPEGFTVPVAEMDVRVGGKHLFCMESPDGRMKIWTTGEYTEVIPNERLVFTSSPADEKGNITSPAAHSDLPLVTVVTVLLEDVGGRTKMVMTHAGLPEGEQGANEGWKQTFAKMAKYIATLHSA